MTATLPRRDRLPAAAGRPSPVFVCVCGEWRVEAGDEMGNGRAEMQYYRGRVTFPGFRHPSRGSGSAGSGTSDYKKATTVRQAVPVLPLFIVYAVWVDDMYMEARQPRRQFALDRGRAPSCLSVSESGGERLPWKRHVHWRSYKSSGRRLTPCLCEYMWGEMRLGT